MKKNNILFLLLLILVIITPSCSDDDKIDTPSISAPEFRTDKEEYIIGETVYLYAEDLDDDTNQYYWHFGFEGVGAYSTDKNTSITYSRPGTYVIKLTVTNKDGAYNTSEKEIIIDKVNEAPDVDFDISPTVSVIGEAVKFTDKSKDDGEIVSWLWNFGDGATSRDQNPEHTYSEGGFIKVKLTVTDDKGLKSEREKTLYVRSSLTPGVLNLIWSQTYESSSKLRSVSPAVGDNGNIYVTSNGLKLYSYSPDGIQNWTFDLSKDGAVGNQESSPMVDTDGTIYVGVGQGSSSSNAYLYAINPDGTEKWKYLVGVGARIAYTSPVLTSEGYIAIGNRGSGGSLKVVDRSGRQVWAVTPSGGVGGGLAADNAGNIYAGSTGSNGFSISRDGKVSSIYLGAGSGANGTSPAIDLSGNIYIVVTANNIGSVMSYNNQGVKNWEFTAAGSMNQGGAAIGADGTIYVGDANGTFYALTRNGSTKWTYTNAYSITCVPAIDSEGFIHITDEGGYYTILDSNGNVKEQIKLGSKIWSSPVISDYGIIYVTVEDGSECKLIALDYGIKGPADSVWAQKGKNARRSGLAN